MTDQARQKIKVTDEGAEKHVRKTPESAKHDGVIAQRPNQDVHAKAIAVAQANDKYPSGIQPAVHESFGIKGDLSARDTGRKPAKPKQIKEDISESVMELKALAKHNSALEPVEKLREHADQLPPGPQKDMLTKLSRDQAKEFSPEMRQFYQHETLTNTPDSWLHATERIAQLPFDKQLEVAVAAQDGKTVSSGKAVVTIRDAVKELQMPKIPEYLEHLKLQKAGPELLENIERKGRKIVLAQPGTDDYRYLIEEGLEGSAGNADLRHILLKPDAKKITALEEFLHGTQENIGLVKRVPREIAEYRVKDFMIRHRRMLGLDENDVLVLEALKEREAQKALRWGHSSRLFKVGEHE